MVLIINEHNRNRFSIVFHVDYNMMKFDGVLELKL